MPSCVAVTLALVLNWPPRYGSWAVWSIAIRKRKRAAGPVQIELGDGGGWSRSPTRLGTPTSTISAGKAGSLSEVSESIELQYPGVNGGDLTTRLHIRLEAPPHSHAVHSETNEVNPFLAENRRATVPHTNVEETTNSDIPPPPEGRPHSISRQRAGTPQNVYAIPVGIPVSTPQRKALSALWHAAQPIGSSDELSPRSHRNKSLADPDFDVCCDRQDYTGLPSEPGTPRRFTQTN